MLTVSDSIIAEERENNPVAGMTFIEKFKARNIKYYGVVSKSK